MADVSQIKLPNGSVYDLIDEKSGYITAEYIENKTDYEIPVSRVGEIVVGETAIGTDSTNFPTSKAVVDYVDERVVQEMDAIDVGVTSINGKTGSVTLSASDVGAATISQIPTSTSQLMNDSGFITSYKDEKVKQEVVSSSITKHLSILLAPAVNGTYTTTTYKDGSFTYQPSTGLFSVRQLRLQNRSQSGSTINTDLIGASTTDATITFPDATGTVALTSDIPTVPTNISSFTNDSGYLTASDIASVMTYKGTKANYAALPSTGNITGDVWHLTDTGAEWAWDGSAWQELGTAIDLSNYLTTSDIAAWAKASTKPTYTAAEVGALPDTTTIPSKTSDLTNDSGFVKRFVVTITGNNADGYSADKTFSEIITAHNNGYEVICIGPYGSTIPSLEFDADIVLFEFSAMTVENIPAGELVRINASNETFYSFITYTESDPTVPGWAKAPSKPSYELTEINGTNDLRAIEALTGTSGLLKKTAANTWTLDTNTYLTSYTETDPVFSASAASGITATDISNWNGKSSTDEKVKQTPIGDSNSTIYGLIVAYNNGGTETTDFVRSTNKIYINNSTPSIIVGKDTDTQRLSIRPDRISFIYNSGNHQGYLKASSITGNDKTWTLPDKTGTVALTSDIPDTSSFLTSETDPVFSASAAAGITSTDISNWNAKVSDDKTWNGVSLGVSGTYTAADQYIPVKATNALSGTASQIVATQTPAQYRIAKYDDNAYLNSTTPSANDNSTKVATTAYVDAAIPNTSGFSTTDEKVKINSVISGTKYYPIVATDTTAATTRQYDKDGFVYDVYRNASATGTGILTLGNNKVSGTSGNVQGKLILFGSTAYSHRIEGTPTADRILTLPDANGTIALTSDIPTVYSSTNTGGYLTMATLPIYDGTVV